MYYIGCLVPVKTNRFFCVMTHDGSEDSSVGVVIQAIKKRMPDAEFICLRKDDKGSSGMLNLLFKKSFLLASSATVLMDNEFLPFAYVKPRGKVKVVQLWHGTGTIKKFGHDISEGRELKLVEKADSRITHLIVNSEYTAKLYKDIFGVTRDKVYVTGIPRTDVMFDDSKRERDLKQFYSTYPELTGKKLILYAPTFRDNQTEHPELGIDLETWIREMENISNRVNESSDCSTVLMLRLHPHVAAAFDDKELKKYGKYIINMSDYADLNVLLFAADVLITDYSSIVFEYALLDKPMYFYAYDLEQFERDSRGFYENYESFVPGKVVKTTKELFSSLQETDQFEDKRKEFIDAYYSFLDGKSTERVINLIL